MRSEASKQGINSADCDWLCLTNEAAERADGKVTARQIAEGSAEFYKRLRESDAKVIVTFGPEAARAVLGTRLPLDNIRGYVYRPAMAQPVTYRARVQVGEYKTSKAGKYAKGDPKYGMKALTQLPELPCNCRIVPTYSIQYVAKMQMKPIPALALDLKRAADIARGFTFRDDSIFDDDRNFSTVPIEDWEPYQGIFAFDIEARATPTGYSRDVDLISMSDGRVTMSLRWSDEVREYCKRYLGQAKYKKYAHNAAFDVPRLRDAGCPVIEPYYDTMLGHQLLMPDLRKGLGKCASLYLTLSEWKSKSDSDPFFYSAKDAFVTALLAEQIEKRLRSTGMMDRFVTMCAAIPTLVKMHEEGIKVDLVRAGVWADDLKRKLEDCYLRWTHLTIGIAQQHNEAQVLPTSSAQVNRLLYKWLGMVPRRNKMDGITAGADALFDLKVMYPEHAELLNTLLEYRDLRKQYGTYAKVLAGLMEDNLDRVHPSYLPGAQEGETGTRKGSASTGRLGVSNPNIQNQTPDARRMYIPDSPDHCFLELDYSQAELRVIAALAQDADLMVALEGDIHTVTAERLGIPRKLAKNALYASCYLGGAKTIQQMLKKHGDLLSISDIKRAQAGLRSVYTRMFAWQQAVVAEGAEKGYLVNPFGRVRFFYGRDKDAPEMADFNPQSTVADICWYLMPELDERAGEFGGRLVTNIHDSFVFCVPADQVEPALRTFKKIMEQEFPQVAPGFHIPIAAKVGRPGQSWGDLGKEEHGLVSM